MFTRLVLGISCFMAIGCAPEKEPNIEYYAVLSNRSAEYNMYNAGTVSKLPTYWRTETDGAEADTWANVYYNSWANKMWRPPGWDQEPEIIWEDEIIEIPVTDPAHQQDLNNVNSDITTADIIIAELEGRIAAENSCTIDGRTLQHNQTILAYTKSSVEYNQTCPITVSRRCMYGNLNGDSNARYTTCSPKTPKKCQYVTGGVYVTGGIDRAYVDHGQSIELWPNPIEDYTCKGKSVRRTCTNGAYSIPFNFPHPSYQKEEYYIFSTCHVPLRSGVETSRTNRITCPTISEYNMMNTHNYPSEFSQCLNTCFDRTGYFGSLLPESHPHYIKASVEKREACFQCEMQKYSSQCYYPRDQFYVFKYTQEIDPKEVFNLGF